MSSVPLHPLTMPSPLVLEAWPVSKTTHSNNVGEFLVVVCALSLVVVLVVTTRCVLHYESKIAVNNTLGIWKNCADGTEVFLVGARRRKVIFNKIAAQLQFSRCNLWGGSNHGALVVRGGGYRYC